MVTDSMFTVAAQELANAVATSDLQAGSLFPPLSELRAITARSAGAVVRVVRDRKLGRAIDDGAVAGEVERAMWYPSYPGITPG